MAGNAVGLAQVLRLRDVEPDEPTAAERELGLVERERDRRAQLFCSLQVRAGRPTVDLKKDFAAVETVAVLRDRLHRTKRDIGFRRLPRDAVKDASADDRGHAAVSEQAIID